MHTDEGDEVGTGIEGHAYHEGVVLCGFTTLPPKQWPKEHSAHSIWDADLITHAICQQEAARKRREVRAQRAAAQADA